MDFVSLAIAVMLFLRIEKAKGKSFGRYFHPGMLHGIYCIPGSSITGTIIEEYRRFCKQLAVD